MASSRKVIECRLYPAGLPCEFVVSGDAEQVLKIAVEHAVESHGLRDTPSLRERLLSMLREQPINVKAA